MSAALFEVNTLPRYDAAACTALMRGGSKTFFAASRLLPRRVRAPAVALYAFCRLADDEIDQAANAELAAQAVRQLQLRLDAVYAGRPQAIDVDRALACVVHQYTIPRELLDALLEGFMWDASGRKYATLEDLQAYAARVAGNVGAMMALVMGVHDEAALARACDLGVAMQLTNIARDVAEDARNGRLYLPSAWLHEAGIDAQAWLAAPRFDSALLAVVQRLLATADTLYRRAEHGISSLPRDCRPAIQAARLVYAEIGREIARKVRRAGPLAITARAVVSAPRKVALISRAALAAIYLGASAKAALPVLPAVQYLVQAALTTPRPRPLPKRSLDDRVGWVIELCERRAWHQRAL